MRGFGSDLAYRIRLKGLEVLKALFEQNDGGLGKGKHILEQYEGTLTEVEAERYETDPTFPKRLADELVKKRYSILMRLQEPDEWPDAKRGEDGLDAFEKEFYMLLQELIGKVELRGDQARFTVCEYAKAVLGNDDLLMPATQLHRLLSKSEPLLHDFFLDEKEIKRVKQQEESGSAPDPDPEPLTLGKTFTVTYGKTCKVDSKRLLDKMLRGIHYESRAVAELYVELVTALVKSHPRVMLHNSQMRPLLEFVTQEKPGSMMKELSESGGSAGSGVGLQSGGFRRKVLDLLYRLVQQQPALGKEAITQMIDYVNLFKDPFLSERLGSRGVSSFEGGSGFDSVMAPSDDMLDLLYYYFKERSDKLLLRSARKVEQLAWRVLDDRKPRWYVQKEKKKQAERENGLGGEDLDGEEEASVTDVLLSARRGPSYSRAVAQLLKRLYERFPEESVGGVQRHLVHKLEHDFALSDPTGEEGASVDVEEFFQFLALAQVKSMKDGTRFECADLARILTERQKVPWAFVAQMGYIISASLESSQSARDADGFHPGDYQRSNVDQRQLRISAIRAYAQALQWHSLQTAKALNFFDGTVTLKDTMLTETDEAVTLKDTMLTETDEDDGEHDDESGVARNLCTLLNICLSRRSATTKLSTSACFTVRFGPTRLNPSSAARLHSSERRLVTPPRRKLSSAPKSKSRCRAIPDPDPDPVPASPTFLARSTRECA